MKRLSSAISMLLALIILGAALGALAYSVIEDPAVLGPLAAAVVVIAVAIYQRRWEKSQELEKLHRAQMTPIYDQVVETVKDIVAFAERPPEEQVAFFRDVSSKLLLHGPPSVVMAWIAWQRSLGVEPYSVPFRAQEKLLLAIRDPHAEEFCYRCPRPYSRGPHRGQTERGNVRPLAEERHPRTR